MSVRKPGLDPFRKRTRAPLAMKSNCQFLFAEGRTSALSKRTQIWSFYTISVAGRSVMS